MNNALGHDVCVGLSCDARHFVELRGSDVSLSIKGCSGLRTSTSLGSASEPNRSSLQEGSGCLLDFVTASSLRLALSGLSSGVDKSSDCSRAPAPTLMSIAAACMGGGGSAALASEDVLASLRCREPSKSKGSFERLTGMNGIEKGPDKDTRDAG